MKIRIIGGSHAGISTALRAREEYPDSEIVIYEKQKTVGFIAQSIPLYLSGKRDFLQLSSYTTSQELSKKGIIVKTETVVRNISPNTKELTLISQIDDSVTTDTYDKLVLATGSYPSLPLVKGDFHDKLFVIKDFEDAIKIKKLMETGSSVIVIGGGAVGTEVARIMNENGLKTTIVQSNEYILDKYLDREVAAKIGETFRNNGIDIVTSSYVVDVRVKDADDKNKKQIEVITKDNKTFSADGVIYATGFRPNSFLIADQVELGDSGAIVVDDYMRTSIPDVFAVGDCATTTIMNVKTPIYVPHVSDAIRQGEIAAINLVEEKRKIHASQGTYKLNFDQESTVCLTGLTKQKATEEGFDCESAFIRNDYLNSDKYFEMWLIYEKGSHKILGLQCRGNAPEISAQADIMSLAIQQQMTVEDLEFVDFYFKHGYRNPKQFSEMLADAVRQQEQTS